MSTHKALDLYSAARDLPGLLRRSCGAGRTCRCFGCELKRAAADELEALAAQLAELRESYGEELRRERVRVDDLERELDDAIHRCDELLAERDEARATVERLEAALGEAGRTIAAALATIERLAWRDETRELLAAALATIERLSS